MWNKILSYLYLRKSQPAEQRPGFNLRMMHGINRISLFIFLFGIIVLLLRWLF